MGDDLESGRPAKRVKFDHAAAHRNPSWPPSEPQFHGLMHGHYQDQTAFIHPGAGALDDAKMAASIHPVGSRPQGWAGGIVAEVPDAIADADMDDFLQNLNSWPPSVTMPQSMESLPLPLSEPDFGQPSRLEDMDPMVQSETVSPFALLSHVTDMTPPTFDTLRAPLQSAHQPADSSTWQFDPLEDSSDSDQPLPPPKKMQRKSSSKPAFTSPFTDCIGIFGKFSDPRYSYELQGPVNGYVKFNWGPKEPSEKAERPPPSPALMSLRGNSQPGAFSFTLPQYRAGTNSPSIGPMQANPGYPGSIILTELPEVETDFWSSPGPSSTQTSPKLPFQTAMIRGALTRPGKVPPSFGSSASMDHMDRRFWEFYIYNWCPGRSILKRTNLWLEDFAQMQSSEGVRAAIQSLAGVYIYDYTRNEQVRQRVNKHFEVAERRLSFLLENASDIAEEQGSEIITTAAILSMQDVILTERRRKKPDVPRWLKGFQQGEHFLRLFDPGSRFWKSNNVQLTSLRISQSVIIGRAVILAQVMMPLPPPQDLNPIQEAKRFDWLLYGTQDEMYAIHGGCGFSKKLLHTISQVSYCAARLNQEKDSLVVPMTAEYLHQELENMRQWSPESTMGRVTRDDAPVISWVHSLPPGYVIQSRETMTNVTAEAWRFAGLIYLQCRLLRIPRNHQDVLANLENLANCIQIMPTSGSNFTAQAPLLPVFLLGLLSTIPSHKSTSQGWFERVLTTPVRSSVPPLYEALRRIWNWIDAEIEQPPGSDFKLPPSISDRDPWWERLTAKVVEKEEETLCLT